MLYIFQAYIFITISLLVYEKNLLFRSEERRVGKEC